VKTLFNPQLNTIYVDMDGVLADFDRFVVESMGRVFDHATGPEDDDMWNFLKTVPHMYYNLEPTPYAFELWGAVKALGSNVEILTAVPRRHKIVEAEQDKIDWIKKHLGDDIVVNFGPFSGDKWTHASSGDVLIDDRDDNIRDWINKGMGIGIFHHYRNHHKTLSVLKSL